MAEIWRCTNAEYHADTSKIGASMLKVAARSLGEYHGRFVAKNDDGSPLIAREPTKAMLLGSVVHCLVLEPDQFHALYYFRPPGIDGRTKAGKATLADLAARSIGKEEIPNDLYEQAKRMANAILSRPECHDMIAEAVRERAIEWEEDGMVMKCKDDLFIERPELPSDLILDIKTSDDPTPENWMRGGNYSPIGKYRYDLQGRHYCEGTEAYTGRPCVFGAIVVGSSEPYDVYQYDLSAWMEIGGIHRRRAINLILSGPESNWTRPEQHSVLCPQPSQYDYPE